MRVAIGCLAQNRWNTHTRIGGYARIPYFVSYRKLGNSKLHCKIDEQESLRAYWTVWISTENNIGWSSAGTGSDLSNLLCHNRRWHVAGGCLCALIVFCVLRIKCAQRIRDTIFKSRLSRYICVQLRYKLRRYILCIDNQAIKRVCVKLIFIDASSLHDVVYTSDCVCLK